VSGGARPWRLALIVCGAVVVLDQVFKAAIVAGLDPGERIDIALGLELARVSNTGVAFGLLAGGGEGLVLAVTLLALLLLATLFARDPGRPFGWLAVGLIAGGALGNLADRVRDGAVVDYIDPPMWPAFNVADIAITCGVVLLLLVQVHRERAAARASPPE
jgi:signal peptidase II